MIHFDANTHTYTAGGVVVPSVTQALSAVSEYAGVPHHVLEKARQLGTAVHKAVELKLQDRLDESSMDPDVAARFYQFWRWFRAGDFEVEDTEERVYSEKYGFAGTLDLSGKLRGKPALIDVKTTSKLMVTVGPQTAAYEKAKNEQDGTRKKFQRYALMLHEDSFRLEPLTSPSDWSVFLACLTIHKHCRRHING